MNKVCCFGELLLRLSPVLGNTWIREANMPVYVGGAELNVAQALALWEIPVRYSTALPDHYLSHEIIDFLQQKGIDTGGILLQGDRIGSYFLPQGIDMKNAGVIYDRAGSSFASLKPGEINWDKILEGVHWFHFSAISPALSQQSADLCLEAVKACEARSITVSLDLNYRAKLWKYGVAPASVMQQLLPYCNVVMGNIWSANSLLGIDLDEKLIAANNRNAYLQHSRMTASKIMEKYRAVNTVANTFRFDQGAGISYYASIDNEEGQVAGKERKIEKVTDKVGSGDCFMAGLIYGMLEGLNPQQTVEFASAAAVGKLQEKGDATRKTVAFIQSTLENA